MITSCGRRRVRLLPAVLLASALAAAACQGSPASQGANGTASASGVATFITAPQNPFEDNFNPFVPTDPTIAAGLSEIYEPLLWYNSWKGRFTPKLAESYSQSRKSIVFHLRPNVKWSDGKPFSAEDVAFTINLILKHPAIDTNALSTFVASAKAAGTHTVKVTLRHPNVTALYYLGSQIPILPAHVWSRISNPSHATIKNPVTTGPFLVKSVTTQLVVLRRNPHYWNAPEPRINEIELPLYESNTTAAAAMGNDKGWTVADNYIPNIRKTLVAHDPKHYGYWFPQESTVFLSTNDQKYPYSLLAFRRALDVAVNRPYIAKAGEEGYLVPSNPTGLPVQPGTTHVINKSLEHRYAFHYDPAQARKLLRAAGFHWNKTGNLVDPRGGLVTTSIVSPSGATDLTTDSQIIARELKAIGIPTSIRSINGSLYGSDLQNGRFGLALTIGYSGYHAWGQYNPLLNSQFTAPEGKLATADYERWKDKRTDALLQEYTQTSNPARQASVVNRLETIMASRLPVIPLFDFPAWEEYNTTSLVGMPTPKDPYAMLDESSPWTFEYVFANLKPRS